MLILNIIMNVLKKFIQKGSITIIEKPIISGLKYKNNYLNILSEIYSKHKKILVCYPMFYLAKSFKKNFKIDKNIYKINIYYQTNGNHTYGDIGEDLLPRYKSDCRFWKKFSDENYTK